MLSKVLVKNGENVTKNQPLFIIEAMKMETTVTASSNGNVEKVYLKDGTLVQSEDLVISLY